MATPGERPSTIYEDELQMLNGRNGEGSPQGQLIPTLPSTVEERGGFELVPMVENVILAALVQLLQLFDGQRLFVHTPQYH